MLRLCGHLSFGGTILMALFIYVMCFLLSGYPIMFMFIHYAVWDSFLLASLQPCLCDKITYT